MGYEGEVSSLLAPDAPADTHLIVGAVLDQPEGQDTYLGRSVIKDLWLQDKGKTAGDLAKSLKKFPLA